MLLETALALQEQTNLQPLSNRLFVTEKQKNRKNQNKKYEKFIFFFIFTRFKNL